MKAILTKYIGPSNTRGSRIKAFDSDGNSVTVPYDHALDSDANHNLAAKSLRDKMNWKGKLIGGWTADGMAYVFDDPRYTIE